MADRVTPEVRSRIMRRVKGKNTQPEVLVRSYLHACGLRFRIHRRDLPGTPDIVLPRFRAVVFVHGCFWHQHAGCRRAHRPTSNREFWSRKLDRNVERDEKHRQDLQRDGWHVHVIWECELKKEERLALLVESIRSEPGLRPNSTPR